MTLQNPGTQEPKKCRQNRVAKEADVHATGYVVSYLQASKEGGEARGLGKGLCVNNYCTSGQQACAGQEAARVG